MLLPALIIALGGYRQPLVLADLTRDVALRERTIAFLTSHLEQPHVEPTNRLRYWIAYANFRQSAVVAEQVATASTREALLELTVLASRHHFRATLLTHQFGLDDPRDWLDEARTIGAPWEFVSPYLNAPGGAASSDAVWRERTWLARIDPTQTTDIEERFARERPEEDFNAEWVSTFDEGDALPESSVTTLDGATIDFRRAAVDGWTAILVWSTACEACAADLLRFDALAREYAGHVLLVSTDRDAEMVRLFLADRGLTASVVLAPPALAAQLNAVPGTRLLASPDRVVVPLRGVRWEQDLRRAFSLIAR